MVLSNVNFKKLIPLGKLFWLLLMISICGKILPHPPNVTPSISLSFLSGICFPRHIAYINCLLCNLISDLLLSKLMNYNAFGTWSLFTYSSFLLTSYFGSKLKFLNTQLIIFGVILSSFSFWLWTNFGIWLLDEVYPRNLSGLLTCYTLALPFLKNSILGDLLWMTITFILGLRLIKGIRNRYQLLSDCKSTT